MKTLTDEQLTAAVRLARCGRCDGKGFRLVPAEDVRGERIPGEFDKLDCPDCDGNGIRLGICRRATPGAEKMKRVEMVEKGKQRKTAVQPGTKWGKLTVLRPVMKNEHSQVLWEVRCDCGNKIRVWGYNLVKRAGAGNVLSCGCVPRRETGNFVNERSK